MESKDTPDHRSLGDLWSEVGNQVTGSDIESGYSYVYTWLANQFGHFMIGFAGTILFGWLVIFAATALAPISGVDYQWRWPWAGVAVALAWFVFWVLKEWLLDVASALRDVHFAKEQREDLENKKPIKTERPKHVWPYWADVLATLRNYYITRHKLKSPEDWFKFDVVRDSQMDMSCYLLGMLTALAMYAAPRFATKVEAPPLTGWIPLLALFVVFIVLAHLSKEWLWANIVFDKAQLPFVSRFVLIVRPFDKDTRERALKFATARTDPGHLVIIGPPKSGRTTTAVALGVEALLQTRPPREVVVYTTLCKLLDRLAENPLPTGGPSGPPGDRAVWPPEDAQLLIVDDVGAEGVDAEGKKIPLLSSELFKEHLQTNPALREICGKKRVIWVVGDDPERADKWEDALKSAFEQGSVEPRVLRSVELLIPIPRGERLRSARQMARMAAYGT